MDEAGSSPTTPRRRLEVAACVLCAEKPAKRRRRPGWLPRWVRLCDGHAAPAVRAAWRAIGAKV